MKLRPTGQWKFFGNPYNFPVDLIDVRTQSGMPIVDGGSIFTWTGLGGWESPGPSIEPWKGYIINQRPILISLLMVQAMYLEKG